jgi:DNA end-binding protein Ku
MPSVWSGHLVLGLMSAPIRLFSGARSSGIAFNMLHATDKQRVKQQYICPVENIVVDRAQIVKGYEFRKGEFITIHPDEIKKIEPQSSKTMEIIEFCKAADIDALYFESSYYMQPEEAGRRPYALLAKTLEASEYVAISKVAMHNREYTVFIRPHLGGLVVHTMYYEDEVRKPEGFGQIDVEIKDAEIAMVTQMITAMEEEWEPSKFSDSFQENLKKLIEAKLSGEELPAPAAAPKIAPVVDLMASLKASLEAMEKKKASKPPKEKKAEKPEKPVKGKKKAA